MSSWSVGNAVNSLTRRLDVDLPAFGVDVPAVAAVAVLMFGSCSRWEAGPDQNPPEKWRRAENDLCPVGSEGKLDACQLDAGPSRANEKYAYQRLVIAKTLAWALACSQTVSFTLGPAVREGLLI